MGSDTAVASTGPGDSETEWELEEEHIEALEEARYQIKYPHIQYPSSGDDSDSDSGSGAESYWSYNYGVNTPIGAEEELLLQHSEDIFLTCFEQAQDDEDYRVQMEILLQREEAEWPEILQRHPDETAAMAHRRQFILGLVRSFLFGR